MKQFLTLVVASIFILGMAAATGTAETSDVCKDTSCEVAEAQGLYTDLAHLSASIEDVKTTLERCETEYCRSVDRNADGRLGLVTQAERASSTGDFDQASAALEEVAAVVRTDIEASEGELENGKTDEKLVRTVLDQEEDILRQTDSALGKTQQALLVGKATDCPDRCGPEVSEAAKNVVKFKAGAELSKSATNVVNDPPVATDRERMPERVERGLNSDDRSLYCWGSSRSCENRQIDTDGSNEERSELTGRNPQTGKEIQIAAERIELAVERVERAR